MFLWININILFFIERICFVWHVYAFVSLLYSKRKKQLWTKKDSHLALSHKRKNRCSHFKWFFFRFVISQSIFFSLFVIKEPSQIQQKRQITITKCATKEDKSLVNWICCILIEARENNGQVLYIPNQFVVAVAVALFLRRRRLVCHPNVFFRFRFLLGWFGFYFVLYWFDICLTHVSNHQISSFHRLNHSPFFFCALIFCSSFIS